MGIVSVFRADGPESSILEVRLCGMCVYSKMTVHAARATSRRIGYRSCQPEKEDEDNNAPE